MDSIRYKVFFTPLADQDANTYGTEIDVSDRVRVDGIGNIVRGIDAADYDIGVYYFGDVTISAQNHNGYFNEPGDYRSIFGETRDRCKVRIVFEETTLSRNDQTGQITDDYETETITFRGLISEEATREDLVTDRIEFRVLSRDSVLKNTKISSGVVANGSLASTAMLNILDIPKVTSVLTIDEANINPDLDVIIDDGSKFNNKPIREMLNQLLVVTNSCMTIDDAGVLYIKSRDADDTRDILNLYGKSDQYGRENIIDITSYNAGLHRMFTSVAINGQEVNNDAYQQTFGYRQKRADFDFITTDSTEISIATRLLSEFKAPKKELHVKVKSAVAKDVQILDRVSVNYPHRVRPVEGKFLPVVGSTKIDDADMPLPHVYGSVSIEPNIRFKVIEIDENPDNFTSILKLRQDGTDVSDGYYNEPSSCIIGFAVIDDAVICDGGDECLTYASAPVGAAQVGCTEIQP